jgi:hypothetical protein
MAFTSISEAGVPSAELKQGLSLTDQTEEAPVTVTQDDGNRLMTVIDRSSHTYTAVNDYTLSDTGQIAANWYPASSENLSLKGCVIKIPPDIDELRVYIDCTDSTAAFSILYDATYSTSLAYGSDSISMGGATSVNEVITDLVGIGFLGLAYTNDTGGDVDITIRFSCETAYSLQP